MIGMKQSCLWGAMLLAGASCGPSNDELIQVLRERCIAQMVSEALGGRRTGTMAANIAGPFGLVPSSDPAAPPYVPSQLQIVGPDRKVRFFMVDSAQWTRAALLRMTPTDGEPNFFVAVIDRRGAIVATGRIENRRVSVSAPNDPQATRDAVIERSLWTSGTAGPVCAELTRLERRGASRDR